MMKTSCCVWWPRNIYIYMYLCFGDKSFNYQDIHQGAISIYQDADLPIKEFPVFKIRSETCQTKAQFCQNLYMIKKESLPDRPQFCRSGSAVWHLFWRLNSHFRDKTASWLSVPYNGTPYNWKNGVYIEMGPCWSLMWGMVVICQVDHVVLSQWARFSWTIGLVYLGFLHVPLQSSVKDRIGLICAC